MVVAAPDVFLGEVVKVHSHQSEVRTLYDLGWELPVKIGSGKIDSLLLSGHEPRLTLISKKKPAEAGMEVYLASSQYPYGLLVGLMSDPSDSDKNLFQEAVLALPYTMSDLHEVYIRITE
jgi:cell shape-determining protein MreC